MTITNEFFGIRCMPNWAQELDPILHRYACPEGTNEYAESDLAAGQMMKAMRGIEARFLNLILGTEYTDNLLIQPDCAEASVASAFIRETRVPRLSTLMLSGPEKATM